MQIGLFSLHPDKFIHRGLIKELWRPGGRDVSIQEPCKHCPLVPVTDQHLEGGGNEFEPSGPDGGILHHGLSTTR